LVFLNTTEIAIISTVGAMKGSNNRNLKRIGSIESLKINEFLPNQSHNDCGSEEGSKV
jgi:hypothetical protein